MAIPRVRSGMGRRELPTHRCNSDLLRHPTINSITVTGEDQPLANSTYGTSASMVHCDDEDGGVDACDGNCVDTPSSQSSTSSQDGTNQPHHVVYGAECTAACDSDLKSESVGSIEVGSRILDVLTGFVGTVTDIVEDNVVFICEETGVTQRRIHSVVALGYLLLIITLPQ